MSKQHLRKEDPSLLLLTDDCLLMLDHQETLVRGFHELCVGGGSRGLDVNTPTHNGIHMVSLLCLLTGISICFFPSD